jgi:hypothetical protein
MKKEEVPQDGNNIHNGVVKQLFYAVDDNGKYTQVPSVGWEPENVAMAQAWDEVNERVEKARQQVLAGKVSPIAYYMEKQLMNIALLARYVGKFQWQVKRHMKPKVFERLSNTMLHRYAAAFKITVQELKQVK